MQLAEQLKRRSPMEIGIMATIFLGLLAFIYTLIPDSTQPLETNFCPQYKPLVPNYNLSYYNSNYFYTSEYSNKSLTQFQGAIKIPTVSYDDLPMDVTKDPRFKVFKTLHEYFEKTFPLTSQYVEFVNEYGLLYTIQGSNPSLKPVVLMSHQDVVPVAESSLDLWDYPPFEAHFDGEYIHGRGSSDTKNSLLAILEATETLLEQDYSPERTLILSFGFDEEISGYRGAGELGKTIHDRYGDDGIEVIIDEGSGVAPIAGARVVALTVAEKGYVDINVSLDTTGGHSSLPPDHTNIGIISEFVTLLEQNPFPPELNEGNPVLPYFQCLAEHAPKLNEQIRRTVLEIEKGSHKKDFIEYVSGIPLVKYLIRTSQAADVIQGGSKVNALPERTTVSVNHRINIGSSVADIVERFEKFATDLARKYDFGVVSFGETLIEPTAKGVFTIDAPRTLETAPLSPTSGEIWEKVAGTSLHVFNPETNPFIDNDTPVFVAPAVFPANTDTRHYWSNTRAIYRFNPVFQEDMIEYHTVNERLRWRSHLTSTAWFYDFILNTTL